MRKTIIILSSLLIFSVIHADVKMYNLTGKVEIYSNNTWVPAQKGMVLSQDNKIKTADDGRAIIQFNEQSKIWIKRNSELSISSLGENNFFSLMIGKIRAKVKLAAGNKFRVQTPVSVASIRGTEFIMSSEGDLSVMEGNVQFSDLKLAQNIEVGQGQFGQVDPKGQMLAPRDLTPEEKQGVTAEWQEFDLIETKDTGHSDDKKEDDNEAAEKKNADLKNQMAQLKSELVETVSDMKTQINVTRELTNEIKESDLSAGRTLRDVHGNLVRVEQHLLRPNDQTLEFLNITKRSDYTYKDHLGLGWGYKGTSGARLDIMDVTMKMNMSLPEQLTEWPSFISSKGDGLHPDRVEARFTNQTDEFKSVGVWKLEGQLDENNKPLKDDRLVFGNYINGWKVDMSYDAYDDPNAVFKEGTSGGGDDSGEVWFYGISPQIKLVKNGQVQFVRILNEGYGITNGGAILNINSFTSSSDNPFTYFKQIAGEYITFCQKLDGTDFFLKGNLDLVIIPDVIVSTALKLATEAQDLMDNKKTNDK